MSFCKLCGARAKRTPAQVKADKIRSQIALARIDGDNTKVAKLEKQLADLEAA